MSKDGTHELLVDYGRPSIFQLIARDSLSASIQPAVQHLFKYLYQSNPSRYNWLWKWNDELFVALYLIIENFYLKTYGGSIVENFYGMKRVINGTCKSASTGFPKLRSLFILFICIASTINLFCLLGGLPSSLLASLVYHSLIWMITSWRDGRVNFITDFALLYAFSVTANFCSSASSRRFIFKSHRSQHSVFDRKLKDNTALVKTALICQLHLMARKSKIIGGQNTIGKVGWPYVLKKLEKFHSVFSLCATSGIPRRTSIGHILLKFYPWIRIFFATWAFFLKITYILSWTDIHSPEFKFANVHLEKLISADLISFNETNERTKQRKLAFLIRILIRSITFGLYLIQFLDFYYNSDAGANLQMEEIKRSRKYPPAPHQKLRESSVLLLETNKCPLCLRQRTNDTALAVSGYVFCFECIYSYIQHHKNCPVTGLSASVDDLIKIYVHTV